MTPIIELDAVTFEYAAVPGAGVFDIDLAVDAGEVVVLCGPSGSGKSTVAKVVNGLASQFYGGRLAGRCCVAGADVATISMARLSELVGSVFQDPRTEFFTGDVTSELAFGPENLGWAPPRIKSVVGEVAAEFRLTDLLDRGIGALSGGEQQRLACAAAAIADPVALVLDEPSSTLDARSVQALAAALESWKRAGKAILIAEHRLDYLAGIADRFVHLDQGRVTGDYCRDEFLGLGPQRWDEMGLRSPVGRPVRPLASSDLPTGGGSLTCQAVVVRRGARVVLDIGAAAVPLGVPVALIGPNGSGKSTWARWLTGLADARTGAMTLDGAVVKPRRRLDACYLVAQNTSHQLFCESVLAEVMLQVSLSSARTDASAVATDILSELGLEQLASRHPMTLSGGEKQRLVIAVAMAARRRLVVLDEPTSGLDATHMRQVVGAIRKLSSGGSAVIVITHDADLVAAACGTAVALDEGRVVAQYALDDDGLDRACAALSPFGCDESSMREAEEIR